MDGVVALAPSLDHLGPISATVAEAALTFDAIADRDRPSRNASLDRGIEGLRIAYARNWFAGDPGLDPAVLRATDAAAERLARLGADVTGAQIPDYTLMHAAGAVLLHAESLALHRADLAARGAIYGRPAFRALIAGVALTDADLAAARRAAILLRAEIDTTILKDHDLILTATTLTPAPPLAPFRNGRPVWTPMRTLPFNLTGHPALSLPAGLSGGLPIAVQIIGRAGDEATVCRAGQALEKSLSRSSS